MPCSEAPLPLGTWAGWLLMVLLVLYAAFVMGLLEILIKRGKAWATGLVSALLVSPVPLLVAAWTLEDRPPWKVLDPRHQSWGFLLDLAGAVLLAVCARAWQVLPLEGAWWHSGWWSKVAMAAGVLAAFAFHLHEAGAYDLLRFDSWTKLIHDLAAVLMLVAMTVFAATPVLLHGWKRQRRHYAVIVLALLVVWIGGFVRDNVVALDTHFLHPAQPASLFEHPVTHHPQVVPAKAACD